MVDSRLGKGLMAINDYPKGVGTDVDKFDFKT